jgi:hypothetical protein
MVRSTQPTRVFLPISLKLLAMIDGGAAAAGSSSRAARGAIAEIMAAPHRLRASSAGDGHGSLDFSEV